jgi:hypothetical protein
MHVFPFLVSAGHKKNHENLAPAGARAFVACFSNVVVR